MKTDDDDDSGNTTVTVDCRADDCGYSTDLSTLSDTNPSRCPKCGEALFVSGTADEYEAR
jgi:predicted Zn-ribbon and HTH transcriptional regulator